MKQFIIATSIITAIFFYIGIGTYTYRYIGGEGYKACQIDENSPICKNWKETGYQGSKAAAAFWPVAVPILFSVRNPFMSGVIIPAAYLGLLGLGFVGMESKNRISILRSYLNERQENRHKLLNEKYQIAQNRLMRVDPEFAKELAEITTDD